MMMISPRVFIGAVGAVSVLIAAFLLFMPFSVAESVPCGNAVSVNTSRAFEVDTFEASRGRPSGLTPICRIRAESKRTWGFVLGGVGLVAAAGALLVRVPSRPTSH